MPPGITPEKYKVLREEDAKFQLFMFYSVINIYDAKLKKNFVLPIDQSWSFIKYPDLRLGFTIEIDSDGAYGFRRTRPANSSSPVIEIRKP